MTSEFDAQVALTKEFINADSSSIDITRRTKTITDDGGYIWDTGVVGAAQNARILLSTDNSQVFASDGTLINSELVVLGMPDFDVVVGDTFSWDAKLWQVVSVDSKPAYLRKAEAVRYSG